MIALCLAACCVAAGGCSDDSGDPTKPANEKVLDVGVDDDGNGACLLVDEAFPAEVEKLPVIACDQPHTHEIFARVAFFDANDPDKAVDVFPGLSALDDFAQRECIKAFEPYVGISLFDSVFVPTWLLPTLDSWNDEDDRDVLCVLTDPNRESLTGSARGSQQ